MRQDELPFASNVMVVGEKRKFLSVLIALKCLVDSSGVPTGQLTQEALDYLQAGGAAAVRSGAVLTARRRARDVGGGNHPESGQNVCFDPGGAGPRERESGERGIQGAQV